MTGSLRLTFGTMVSEPAGHPSLRKQRKCFASYYNLPLPTADLIAHAGLHFVLAAQLEHHLIKY